MMDIISDLPDSLLIDILSLLSPSDVKQTRLVSKRWKNLVAFLPNLGFVLESLTSFEQAKKVRVLVDQTLGIRGDMPIKKLLLKDGIFFCSHRRHDLLSTFLRFKVVQELELSFPYFEYGNFCWDYLFKTWDTLIALTLEGGRLLNVPNDKLIFPCLKKLSLLSFKYPNESVANLIYGCPVLEELSVEARVPYVDVAGFKVSSLSLKRLRICLFSFRGNIPTHVVIDAPKLEYIYINNEAKTSYYSLTKPLSLVKADICHSSISELIPFLSSAKILRLFVHSRLDRSHVHGLIMPVFPNLVRLVICHKLEFLPVWLSNMPNLEDITFSYWDRVFIAERDLPEEPPVCLRFMMKQIVVHNRSIVTQEEFTFLRYMLEHSLILKKLRFTARRIDPEMREQLQNFHRGSKRCQIEFVERLF